MTPVAAYYLFLAEEDERARAKTYGFRSSRPSRPSRPSPLDRVRAIASALRSKPRVTESARTARTA